MPVIRSSRWIGSSSQTYWRSPRARSRRLMSNGVDSRACNTGSNPCIGVYVVYYVPEAYREAVVGRKGCIAAPTDYQALNSVRYAEVGPRASEAIGQDREKLGVGRHKVAGTIAQQPASRHCARCWPEDDTTDFRGHLYTPAKIM